MTYRLDPRVAPVFASCDLLRASLDADAREMLWRQHTTDERAWLQGYAHALLDVADSLDPEATAMMRRDAKRDLRREARYELDRLTDSGPGHDAADDSADDGEIPDVLTFRTFEDARTWADATVKGFPAWRVAQLARDLWAVQSYPGGPFFGMIGDTLEVVP